MTKYERLYRELSHLAASMQPGCRFPSVRQLMGEHAASQTTVARALDQMKREGKLIAIAASGMFTATPEQAAQATRCLRIGLIVHDYPSAVTDLVVANLTEYLQKRGHFPEAIRYSWRDGIRRSLQKPGVDAYLLFLASGKLETSEVAAIGAFEKPVVICTWIPFGLEIDAVNTDNRAGTVLIASHLREQGHRQTAVVYNEPHNPAGNERVFGFIEAARLLGMDDPALIDCQTPNGQNACLHTYHVVKKQLETGFFPDVTAVFVQSDHGALGVLRALHEAGRNVPDDISVIGFDDSPETRCYQPALTTVGHNLEERWERVMEILNRRLTGYDGPALQVPIAPYLVKRESVCPPVACDASATRD